jgi:hypothetical protein
MEKLYLALLVMCTCSCESAAFLYEYHGLLTRAGGAPAARAKVIAIHKHSADDFRHDRGFYRSWLEESSTTTDDSGQFRGRCNGGGYIFWLWTDLFPPEAPMLDGVDVWVYQDNYWWVTHVPLNFASQLKSKRGKPAPLSFPVRYIELPPLSLPQATTRPDPDSRWYSPDRQDSQKPVANIASRTSSSRPFR